MSLPSASKLQLAMTCVGSAVLPRVDSAHSAGDRGTALGAYLAARVGGTPQSVALLRVPEPWTAAAVDLEEHVLPLSGYSTEVAYSYDVATCAGRCLGSNLGRGYPSGTPTTINGSADFLLRSETMMMVVDLKCGQVAPPAPQRNAQLRLLALASCRAHGLSAARVGILHCPDGQQARWSWADLDAFDLESVADELRELASRIEAASVEVSAGRPPRLAVGDGCRWCPARVYCPAQSAMARRIAGDPESLVADLRSALSEQQAALVWHRVKALKALLVDVEQALYAMARESPIELADGRWLGPKETRREVLDGRVVHAVVERLHGRTVADAAVELEATKAGLKRALAAVREVGGAKLSHLEAEVLREVREAGGASVRVSSSVGESASRPEGVRRGAPEPPALTDAEIESVPF